MTDIQQLAPDKKHDFLLINQYCSAGAVASGSSYWVTVRDLAKPGEEGIQVFYTWEYAPDVSWVDSDHIVITILQVCGIRTSLHEAGTIKVTYRLADNLLENYQKIIDDYEKRATEFTKNGFAQAALKSRVNSMQMQYRQLKEWAVNNAVNGHL